MGKRGIVADGVWQIGCLGVDSVLGLGLRGDLSEGDLVSATCKASFLPKPANDAASLFRVTRILVSKTNLGQHGDSAWVGSV